MIVRIPTCMSWCYNPQMTKLLLPKLLVKKRGLIVNISSSSSRIIPPMLMCYAATKVRMMYTYTVLIKLIVFYYRWHCHCHLISSMYVDRILTVTKQCATMANVVHAVHLGYVLYGCRPLMTYISVLRRWYLIQLNFRLCMHYSLN